jgi:hypothetical protein
MKDKNGVCHAASAGLEVGRVMQVSAGRRRFHATLAAAGTWGWRGHSQSAGSLESVKCTLPLLPSAGNMRVQRSLVKRSFQSLQRGYAEPWL